MYLRCNIDIILPYWWITEHPPIGFTDPNWRNMEFSAITCRGCVKGASSRLFEYDESIADDPEAGIIGFVGAAPTQLELDEAIRRVPAPYRPYVDIMTTEAA